MTHTSTSTATSGNLLIGSLSALIRCVRQVYMYSQQYDSVLEPHVANKEWVKAWESLPDFLRVAEGHYQPLATQLFLADSDAECGGICRGCWSEIPIALGTQLIGQQDIVAAHPYLSVWNATHIQGCIRELPEITPRDWGRLTVKVGAEIYQSAAGEAIAKHNRRQKLLTEQCGIGSSVEDLPIELQSISCRGNELLLLKLLWKKGTVGNDEVIAAVWGEDSIKTSNDVNSLVVRLKGKLSNTSWTIDSSEKKRLTLQQWRTD